MKQYVNSTDRTLVYKTPTGVMIICPGEIVDLPDSLTMKIGSRSNVQMVCPALVPYKGKPAELVLAVDQDGYMDAFPNYKPEEHKKPKKSRKKKVE